MDELLENFSTDPQIKHLHKDPHLRNQPSRKERKIRNILDHDSGSTKSTFVITGPAVTLPDGLRSPVVANFPFYPRGPIPARHDHSLFYKSISATKLEDDISETVVCHKSRIFQDGLETPTVPDFSTHEFGELAEPAAPITPNFPPEALGSHHSETTGAHSAQKSLMISQSPQLQRSITSLSPGTPLHNNLGLATSSDPGMTSNLDQQGNQTGPRWVSARLNPLKKYVFEECPQTMSGRWSIMSREHFRPNNLPQRLHSIEPESIKEPSLLAAVIIVKCDDSDDPPNRNQEQSDKEDLWQDDAGPLFRINLPGCRGTTYSKNSSSSSTTQCDQTFLVGMQNLLVQATVLFVMFRLSWRRAQVMNHGQNQWGRDPRVWRRKAVAMLSKVSRETERLSANLELVCDNMIHRPFLLLVMKRARGVTKLRQAIDHCIDKDLPPNPSLESRPVPPWQAWCGERGPIPNAVRVVDDEVRGSSLVGNQFIPTQGLAILEYWRRQQNEIVDKVSRVALNRADVEWQRLNIDILIASTRRARGDVKALRAVMPMLRTLGAGFPDRNHDDRHDVTAMARFFAQLEGGPGIRMPLIGLYERVFMSPSFTKTLRYMLDLAGDPEVLEWF